MGNHRVLASVLVLAAAACSDGKGNTPDAPVIVIPDAAPDAAPDAYVPDAPNYDFSCYQNAAPTMADAMITISGTAQEAYLQGTSPGVRAAQGVTIQACRGDCTGNDDLGTTGPTPANGNYTLPAVTTGGAPVDGYVIATKTGNRTTYVYPASPLTASSGGVPIFMLSEQLIPLLSLVGIDQDPGNSMMALLVTDCAIPPLGIGGATVTVTQNGASVGDPPVDGSMLSPQGAGTWFVTNVPPGDTTVTATYNGMTFRAHVVGAFADTFTTTQVKPGY